MERKCHRRIGVSTSGIRPYAIFGDMNQEGAFSGAGAAEQNGRGRVFFIIENKTPHDNVQSLISNAPPSSSRRPPD